MERSKMKTTTKQKHNWHIDDTVFYLEETSHNGEFPRMMKGTVEEIKRDCIRVKISGTGWENLVWVDSDKAFKTGGILLDRLANQLSAEIEKLCEPPYDALQ